MPRALLHLEKKEGETKKRWSPNRGGGKPKRGRNLYLFFPYSRVWGREKEEGQRDSGPSPSAREECPIMEEGWGKKGPSLPFLPTPRGEKGKKGDKKWTPRKRRGRGEDQASLSSRNEEGGGKRRKKDKKREKTTRGRHGIFQEKGRRKRGSISSLSDGRGERKRGKEKRGGFWTRKNRRGRER